MPRPSPAPRPKKPVKPAAAKETAKRPAVAFPKKSQPPSPAAFAARLPLSLGKKLEAVRTFLLKQEGTAEDVFFYGPRAGWALRYRAGERPLCSLHLHGDRPVGIVSIDPATNGALDWAALSPVAQKAKRAAHGSPSLLWLDVPLDGTGAGDFRSIVKAKLGLRA